MSLSIIDPRAPLFLLARRAAIHLDQSASLGEAASVMERANVSAILVGDPAVGIVTERDLARGLAAGFGSDDGIEAFTSRPIITLTSGTTVIDAAAMMLNEEVRHVVIVLAGGSLAIISLREVMAALLQAIDPRSWLSSLRLALTDEG